MNRSLAAILSLAVVMPASALAKEPVAVKVCGKTRCHESKDKQAIAPLVNGGPPTEPPIQASGWYSSTIAIGGEGPGASFTVAIVPSQGLVRSEPVKGGGGFTWLRMSPETRAEYARLTAGLEPRPASALAGVAEAPPPSPESSSAGAPAWPWLLGVALLLSADAIAVLRRRAAFGG